jgi:hypothetical protein
MALRGAATATSFVAFVTRFWFDQALGILWLLRLHAMTALYCLDGLLLAKGHLDGD